jgi:hypothetical protein
VPKVFGNGITGWISPKQTAGLPTVVPNQGAGIWVEFEGGDPSYPLWTGTFGVPDARVIVLNDLSDVDAVSPADNEVLTYSAATDSWLPRPHVEDMNYVGISTDPSAEPEYATGRMFWDSEAETVAVGVGNGGTLQLGQETHMLVQNDSGGALVHGTLVMGELDGNGRLRTVGQGTIRAVKAVTDGSLPGKLMLGIVTEDIPDGDRGLITTFGYVSQLNTQGPGWQLGDILWNDPAVPGGLTNVPPSAPNLKLPIAVVTRLQTVNGSIFVRMTEGSELGRTDSNVQFLVPITNGQVLTYNSTSGVWTNQTPTAGGGGVTSVNGDTGPAVVLTAASVGAAPTSHTHTAGDLPNLQDLNGTLDVASGGTGATDSATARTNLGLAIGTDVQAYNATLATVAGGTYTGDDSITTVGTVTAGTWDATDISLSAGGTNASLTAVNGGVVYSGSSAMAITAAGTSGQALVSNGATAPTWKELDLTNLPSSSFKQPVKISTGANNSLSGEAAIGTTNVVSGDRVLVRAQTLPEQNGIYVVSTGAWTRADDADTAAELAGAIVAIQLGDNRGGTLWTTNFKASDTLGTTAMNWYQVVDTSLTSTDARAGIVELATDAETATGTDSTRAVTPAGLLGRTATDARIGLVELATSAETQEGTDSTRAVTPAGLASLQGYRFVQTVYFTTPGTSSFTKATYPWLRAIRVRCVGGGGGGGGVGTTSGIGAAGGGGGGGIAESFITDISGLDSSVTVTVGGGGAGGIGNNAGSTGGTSSFGSITAGGGEGGNASGGNNVNNAGGNGGTASGGDLNLPGLAAPSASRNAASQGGGYGGANRPTGSANGVNGTGTYGGGGSGAQDATTVERTGGAGAGGMVMIELYA